MRKVIIILDGLADKGKNTSLEKAKIPNLNYLAEQGKTGLMYPIKNIAPESGASQFSLLGYPLNKYPGRGIIEAFGINYKIKKNESVLRINFAKFKKNKIINLRISNPNKKMIKKINKIDKDIKLIPTKGYRAVLIIKNLKRKVKNTHPGYKNYKTFSKAINADMKKRKTNSKKLNNFIEKLEKIIPNKTILIRGFGNKIPKLKKLKNWSLIADMPVEVGLGRLLGMKILKNKNKIKTILKTKSNIYVQIKGPDKYGHEGDKKGKIKAIEKIDRQIKPLTKLKNTIICITSDHATPPSLKRHSKDPVPILIYGKDQDKVKKFTEKACKEGKLGIFEGKNLKKYIKIQ